MKWEYFVRSEIDPAGSHTDGGSSIGDDFLMSILNTDGDDRWELVSVIDQGEKLLIIYKRPKS